MPSTITTVYQVTKNGVPMGQPYTTLALAEAAATAASNSPGTYVYEIGMLTQDTVVTSGGGGTSPDPTTIVAGSGALITDASGTKWGISGGVVTVNGTPDGKSANVAKLIWTKGVLWQENTSNMYWESVAGVWTPPNGTSTNPLGGTPPPPPPPPPGGSWVFQNGKFDWQGDWNAIPFNYDQAGAGVNGPGPVIGVPGGNAFVYWLPYPPMNSAGPASNGVNFNLSGLTKFTIAIKPSQGGALAQMQFFQASGATDDIPFGNMVNISQGKYGPATMVAGQWNVYTIPLSDYGVSGWIYKFILQQQGATPQAWEIDQVGFA